MNELFDALGEWIDARAKMQMLAADMEYDRYEIREADRRERETRDRASGLLGDLLREATSSEGRDS
jgi:hypothetical protein